MKINKKFKQMRRIVNENQCVIESSQPNLGTKCLLVIYLANIMYGTLDWTEISYYMKEWEGKQKNLAESSRYLGSRQKAVFKLQI